FGIPNDSVFDDLGVTLTQLLRRKGIKRVDVRDYEGRMMKCPDQILAGLDVDAGFPPDRAVNHCQQRRGNLNVRNATMKNRGNKSGNIADHSAAETENKRPAIEAGRDHFFTNPLDHFERLRIFSW